MKAPGIAVFVGALLVGGAALTQASNIFQMSPADAVTFKTWIATQQVAAIPLPAGFTVAVGAVVPQTVLFYEIPTTAGLPAMVQYRYAKIGDQIVLVNPADRKIVYVVG
jgi:hypothetical protein